MIGLKPSKKIEIYNGPLECRFEKFEVFSGSYKEKVMKEIEEMFNDESLDYSGEPCDYDNGCEE